MTISNGYATLEEFKERWLARATYTATTILFDNPTQQIRDAARGLRRFQTGAIIRVTGSSVPANNRIYSVTVGNDPAAITVAEAPTTAAEGPAVTLSDVTDPVDDATMESIIEAASRWIDAYTGRWFYAAVQTRHYSAEWSDLLLIDDLISLTSLKTDDNGDRVYEQTWGASDYDLEPANAPLDGRPYTRIAAAPTGTRRFPAGMPRGVELTGSFGFATTAPVAVKEACILAAMRLIRRKDAIFGVTGTENFGALRAILDRDPDVTALLAPYCTLRM